MGKPKLVTKEFEAVPILVVRRNLAAKVTNVEVFDKNKPDITRVCDYMVCRI